MRTLGWIVTRPSAVALALSILLACSDSPTKPSLEGGPPTAVEVAFCDGAQPAWVAFQDGDGAWTQALPTTAGQIVTFRHTFAANRGAVATARRISASLTTLAVQYGAPAELTIVGDTNPGDCGARGSKTLLGTVAGLDTNELAIVGSGRGAREVVFPVDGGSFILRGLTPGPQDILATRATHLSAGTALTGVILRRNPDLPDGATIPVLDFDSPEAFQPAVGNVTIDGLGTDGAIVNTDLRTAHGINEVAFLTSDATAATRPYYAIPEARLEPGDLQVLTASTTASTPGARRAATVYFRSPVDRTLTLGALIAPPTLSVAAATPTLRLRARLARQADYDRLAVVTFQQGEGTLVSVGMTEAYAELTGGAYDLVVPELTGVPGFDPIWALRAGTPVLWTAGRVGGTLGLGLNAVPTEGATFRSAVVTGDLTPP